MRKVRVRTPASTTNLGCGFDCLGLALALYNLVEVEFTEEKGLSIDVEGVGAGYLPRDRKNIIFPAMQEVFRGVGKEPPGIKVKQINRIPIGKGLGSSAATRLGGIAAANHLLGAPLSPEQILRIAARLEGHPDNAAASLLGGFTVVTGDEEKLTWIRLDVPENLKVVLAIPELEILTENARRVLPSRVSLSDAIFNLSRVALLVPSLSKGLWDNLPVALQDRLHQPYRASLLPGMEDTFKVALQAGAKGAFLSGAGSGIAAFVLDKEEEVGKAMRDAFLKKNIECTSMILSVDKKGVVVDEKEK